MWLSNSSVGRKFVMALSGAFLVLFVTFHCLMNSIAICWPTAYNSICEFLGANWYALAASAVLALFILIHIIYAIMLTVQNRKARGTARYAISRRPKSVEWSSQNMFVLGIIILAFLVVHLIQFWAKMQLAEIAGCVEQAPPAAGTIFLQEAFSQIWTPIVYIIAFVALWFHMNHGFWSMFQSCGWNGRIWLPRLQKISLWWTSIVIALFVAQAVVFTLAANKKEYITSDNLKAQYIQAWNHEAESAKTQESMMALQGQFLDFLKEFDPQQYEMIQQQMQQQQQYQQMMMQQYGQQPDAEGEQPAENVDATNVNE